MVFTAEDEGAGVLEQIACMSPLQSQQGASAPALLTRDTQISIEESGEARTAALSDQGSASGPVVPSDGIAASDGNSVPVVETRDGGDVPEDWRTLGLLDTVSWCDGDEINRLRGLLDAGASPAALDWAGRTPLHACVVDRLLKPLKVLLNVPGSADVRDASGWPLLNVALLHGWRDGARAVLDAGARVATYSNSSTFPHSEITRYPRVSFEKFSDSNNQTPMDIAIESDDMDILETILKVAERDGVVDCRNGFKYTALKTAISKNNLPAIQALLKRGACPHSVSDHNESALHVATRGDCYILKYLLDNTEVTSSWDDIGRTPLHEAVCANNPEAVKLLLEKFDIERVKSKEVNEEETPLHYVVLAEAGNDVAEIILEKDLEAVDDVNYEGNTPLHLAIEYNNRDLAALLLRKGAKMYDKHKLATKNNLASKNKNGVSVLELILSNFYDATDFFDFVFDGSIYKEDSDDLKTYVDYRVLTNGRDMSQIEVLEEFVRCGRSKALIHPLIESLVYMKWSYYLPLFYAMVCVYAIFLVSVNIFVINVFYHEDMRNTTRKSDGDIAGSGGFHRVLYWLLIVLIYLSILILLLQESFFMYRKRRHYFASVESWVKLAGLVLCAAAPLTAPAPGPWPRHVACAALLLTWLEALFLVSRFPPWGFYVFMFGKVAINILKIFVTAIFLVIAFSFCFMIQYRWKPPFDGPFAAFVKTLVMMSSELDYEGLFSEDHDEQLRDTRTVVRLFVVMFVIFVAIVLMNFMTGMAVSDINELNETGHIRRLEKQVELLFSLEALVSDGILAKWFNTTFGDKTYHMYLVSSIESQSSWYAVVGNYCQNKTNFNILPSMLYNAIMEIIKKNDTMVKRHVIDNKIDALYDAILIDRPLSYVRKGVEKKRKQNNSMKLQHQIKPLVSDLVKVSQEIKDLKLSIEDLNLKINNLPSSILTSMREMLINTRCSGTIEGNVQM